MWLLSTDRAELKFFSSPEDVQEGYAILSHVWDKDEKTFQQVQALHAECEKTGAVPRECADIGYKIRESCRLAERHRRKWIWIDTCCIDKTSSAELSEAINSMFRYYSLSRVCYAFLRDVSTISRSVQDYTRGKNDKGPEFAASLWHRRGWILQELLASQFLVFVSSTWEVLGDKHELAAVLEIITHIPQEVLRFEKDFADISLAERMSWAARRQTTRVEDRAYSLMGIFGINMPTLYGEGQMAFYRLQEEIMKTSTDTSLFSWRTIIPMPEFNDSCQVLRRAPQFTTLDESKHLLAPAPWVFNRDISDNVVEFSTNTGGRYNLTTVDGEEANLPMFVASPHGIRARLPVIQCSDGSSTALLALLFCTATYPDSKRDSDLALFLLPYSEKTNPQLYYSHIATLAINHLDPAPVSRRPWVWTTLYISAKPRFRGDMVLVKNAESVSWFHRTLRSTNTTIDVPFRIPSECFLVNKGAFKCIGIKPAAFQSDYRWTGTPPLALSYAGTSLPNAGRLSMDVIKFTICLGVCEKASGAHWAHLHVGASEFPVVPFADSACETHACERDHVHARDGTSRVLRAAAVEYWNGTTHGQGEFTASFTVCPINQNSLTLVLQLHLS